MRQQTFKLSVNGMQNLGALIKTAGYAGGNLTQRLEIINPSATSVFVHLTGSGSTAPAGGTGSDGIEIGNSASAKERVLTNIDIGLVWLYAAVAVDVKFLAQGY